MKIKLSDLKPNPFYEKAMKRKVNDDTTDYYVRGIVESFKKFDYGKNMKFYVRAGKDGFELVYGHTYRAALMKQYGNDVEAEVVEVDYDDHAMEMALLWGEADHEEMAWDISSSLESLGLELVTFRESPTSEPLPQNFINYYPYIDEILRETITHELTDLIDALNSIRKKYGFPQIVYKMEKIVPLSVASVPEVG